MRSRGIVFGVCLLMGACAVQNATKDTSSSSSSSSLSAVSSSALLKTTVLSLVSQSGERLRIQAEIARTPVEQERGLMERTSLAHDAGMLFVFDAARMETFWMKNTLIPLDVLFFDASGSFVSVQTMQPCHADPCSLYPSTGLALAALEVRAGYAKEHRVGKGWALQQ